MSKKEVKKHANSEQVAAFIEQVDRTTNLQTGASAGRLIFALDATASRQPTWDLACRQQAQMFETVAAKGDLSVQLCFYRGFRECKFSQWMCDADSLLRAMSKVRCMGGQTQIARIFRHTLAEQEKHAVNALVFVGDCMEEDIDELCHLAGKLGIIGVPVFIFQEGQNLVAANAFKQLARLSGGAYCAFDQCSAQQLGDLLRAVAIFATAGAQEMLDYSKRKPALAYLVNQIKAK